ALTDHAGRAVRLGDYFHGDKPVVLVLAYYSCPMLCGLVLRGTAGALQSLSWLPNEQYRVLTVSFDPDDGPEDARHKQAQALQMMGKGATPEHWPFLTAKAEAIARLAEALGFALERDAASGEFAHPAVIFVLSPDGRISRYLY